MAREKIQIKKIANRAAMHVTFSKRRRGLVKKAQELSVLCEADIALLVFSTSGKLFEFSSSSEMRGQNLESLSLKELQLLEKKLEKGLGRIRSRKDNSLSKEVDDLEKKEILNRKENAKLRRQDHAQTSESMCTAYSFNLNKASVQDYEPSDPLQLRLCLHSGI